MFTEVIKIIEGGLDSDKEKVLSYARLLAKNLEQEGEKSFSNKIRKTLEKKTSHPVYLDELLSLPVDQESKLSIADVSYPDSDVPNLVLPYYIQVKLDDFLNQIKFKDALQKRGVDSVATLLLYGPPGCGKTSIASYVSNKSGLPLVTAKLDTLISSLLGSTAKNIRKIFDFANSKPCILFLDEFDAIAKARDDQHELGELKRVVNSLLQNIDAFSKNNILIAATNHEKLLDSAIWRRFTSIVEVPNPESEDIVKLVDYFFGDIAWDFKSDQKKCEYISKVLADVSPSNIKTLCHSTIRKMVISDQNEVNYSDFIYELYMFKNHGSISQKEFSKFLSESGVSQLTIQKLLNISLRQVRNLLEE